MNWWIKNAMTCLDDKFHICVNHWYCKRLWFWIRHLFELCQVKSHSGYMLWMVDPCQNISREHKIYLNFFIILQLLSSSDIWNSSPGPQRMTYLPQSTAPSDLQFGCLFSSLLSGVQQGIGKASNTLSRWPILGFFKFIPEQQKCPAYKY